MTGNHKLLLPLLLIFLLAGCGKTNDGLRIEGHDWTYVNAVDSAGVPLDLSLISVYRQSHQCGERSNAAFGRQSAAKQTSHAPHDSKARLQHATKRRGSWRSHVHRSAIRRLNSSSSA